MKALWLLPIFLLAARSIAAQKHFTLHSFIGTQSVEINGKLYAVDSLGTRIATRYPRFDTLIFRTLSAEMDEPVICNFKPDSAYAVSVACCGSLDIVPMSKYSNDSLRFWDWDADFEKITRVLVDQPYISIRTKRKPQDSIYAWHADAACLTAHQTISKRLWRMGVPPKCYYWNNITYISFFETDDRLPSHEETDMEEFLGIANIVELTSIAFRLFDDQRFVIVYDRKRNAVRLTYE